MELVAATALVAGLIVMAIGLLKLGWLADFLSLPIVVGFMAGIGVIIITHQLPRVLGVPSGGESFISRLQWISHQFGHVSTWSIVLAVGTLVVMVVGEKLNAKLPWALAAVLAATILTAAGSLASHGVAATGRRERRTADLAPALAERFRVGDRRHDGAHPGGRDPEPERRHLSHDR